MVLGMLPQTRPVDKTGPLNIRFRDLSLDEDIRNHY